MPMFRVVKTEYIMSEAYIEAKDWEDAEDKAKYADEVEWEELSEIEPDYDIDEED